MSIITQEFVRIDMSEMLKHLRPGFKAAVSQLPKVDLTAHTTFSWVCPTCDENDFYNEPQEEEYLPPHKLTCHVCSANYIVGEIHRGDY